MKNKTIYLPIQGRIGNQLFQYAFARKIQNEIGEDAEVIIDDSSVERLNWENALVHYKLPNVKYTHIKIMDSQAVLSKQYLLRKIYRLFTRNADYKNKYKWEKRLQPLLNKNGLFLCENGYIKPKLNYENPIYLEGYFQSERYFADVKEDVKRILSGKQFKELEQYPGIDELRKRNSVCISVKVEHNVGSSMYSVCGVEYWKRAIDFIIETVDNPLFFVCSDNIPYVLENLIDTSRFDYVVQDSSMPVHVSLAAMSECKHFVIGNTTFGWWAQYLSDNKDKIVVAPSRWMAIDMPIDIYQDGWKLIEV